MSSFSRYHAFSVGFKTVGVQTRCIYCKKLEILYYWNIMGFRIILLKQILGLVHGLG